MLGETTHVFNRSKEHFRNFDRKRLDSLHIIGDADFNKSATLDIEAQLIQCMAADGKYELQNKTNGSIHHNYYEKEKYQAKFEEIWKELQQRNIVSRGLFEIRNSDLFKYSPYKSLTDEQYAVVENIAQDILENVESKHMIQGEPGTGKTIVAIYLVKYLLEKHENLNIGLVIPMTSLRTTLKKVFGAVKGLQAGMVLGPSEVVNKVYDVLIVDEAHRLNQRKNITNMGSFDNVNRRLGLDIHKGDQLDWILMSTKHAVFCYDKQQTIKPADISPERMASLDAKKHLIQSQMRVKGGQDYILYIEDILHNRNPKRLDFQRDYELYIFEDVADMHREIMDKEEKEHLSRMVAGYAWPWKSRKNSNMYDICIGKNKYRWNSVLKDWIHSPNALNEVGCIHTTQGYDLNYVGVIIGNELRYVDGEIKIFEENYFDRYGKQSIKDSNTLKNYILNIYKTLLTRGICGTYLYICDEGLRNYMKKYIPIYKGQVLYQLSDEANTSKIAENNNEYRK